MRALAVITAISACVAVQSASGADARLARIEVVTNQTSFRATDKPPSGPSVGDRAYETTRLTNEVPQWGKPVGAVAGRDQATFTIVDSKLNVAVDGVAFLPGGTLVLRGRMKTDRERRGIVAPVVRGTGRYAGAHGSVLVRNRSNPPRTVNIYTLAYGG